MIPTVPVTLTHPTSAVWSLAGLLSLLLLAVIALGVLGRAAGLHHRLQHAVLRRQRPVPTTVDAALIFLPETLTVTRLVTFSFTLMLLLTAALWLLGGAWLALLSAPVAFLLLLWLLGRAAEQRYRTQLDAQLGATVARLSALLGSGQGFPPALDRVLADLDPRSPLAQEWRWIAAHVGVPLYDGSLATAAHVVAALRDQTPSARHRALLDHLAIALDQTHDILQRRIAAAAQAIHAADRRASAAAAELAYMRYSGIAVGGAGLVMALYLAVTQWARMQVAYQGTLGLLVGGVVLLALLSPIVGGVLLSRTTDLDY